MIGFEMILALKGITYADVARHFGITRQSVNVWAKNESIPEDKLEGLSEYLGCSKCLLISKVNKEKLEEDIHKYLYL